MITFVVGEYVKTLRILCAFSCRQFGAKKTKVSLGTQKRNGKPVGYFHFSTKHGLCPCLIHGFGDGRDCG